MLKETARGVIEQSRAEKKENLQAKNILKKRETANICNDEMKEYGQRQ